MRAIHFRVEGTTSTRSLPTACLQIGFNTLDTDAVTCPACTLTRDYRDAHAKHSAVIEALAYPKEDHPCLSNHRPSTSETRRNR